MLQPEQQTATDAHKAGVPVLNTAVPGRSSQHLLPSPDSHHARYWCVTLLLLALSPLISLAATPDTRQTAAALKKTVDQLNALDEWFTSAEKRKTAWLTEIRDNDQAINSLQADVSSIEAQLADTENNLIQLQQAQQRLDANRTEQARRISEHMAAAYRLKGQDFVKQLLNQESPDTFERMTRYHRYFSNARAKALQKYKATLEELDQTANKLALEQSLQRTQRKNFLAQQNTLARQRGQRSELLKELAAETVSKSEQYEALQTDRKRLEQLLAELRRRAAETEDTAFADNRGKLPWPVAGRVRHAFGQARAEGRLTWHGIEIRAKQGTPAVAVYRGRVVFADWLRGFGLLLIIDHGGGYMTLYAHADALLKVVGDWVESGETVARAGYSGGQSSSGLYFEVRHKGKPRDPISWLAPRDPG